MRFAMKAYASLVEQSFKIKEGSIVPKSAKQFTKMAINKKQHKFIDEYLIDLNATKAAERAGYSKKTAYSQGQRLLKHVEISAEVQRRQAASSKNAQKTREDIIEDLETVVNKYLMAGNLTTNSLKAIDMLAKMQGWYTPEKQEITHKGITINYTKPDGDKDN